MTEDSSHPRAEAPSHRTLLLVDGDNIDRNFRENGIKVWLDDVANWIPPLTVGLGPIDQICVFMQRNGMKNRGLLLRDEKRFCIHSYDRAVGEPGPPDIEIIQEAWRRKDDFDTFIFMSYDTDFAKFAVEIRQGIWEEGDEPDPDCAHQVLVLGEQPRGVAWRTKLGLPIEGTTWSAYAAPWLSISRVLDQIRYLGRT